MPPSLMWTTIFVGLKTKPNKYSGLLGPFNENSTILNDIDPSLHSVLVSALNCSQSEASWRQYDSVIKGLNKLTNETGISFELPWTEADLINYILVMSKRGLKMSSVKVYLSKVKLAHRFLGHNMPNSVWTPMLLKSKCSGSIACSPRSNRAFNIGSITIGPTRASLSIGSSA